MNFNGAIERGRKHFAPSRAPFSMTVGGETIYVATSAQDVNTIWKSSAAISLDPISVDMYKQGGLLHFTTPFDLHPHAQYNIKNPKPLSPNNQVLDYHRQQNTLGPNLEEMMSNHIVPSLFKHLDFAFLKTAQELSYPTVLTHNGDDSFTISLLGLCISTFIRAETDAFWGPALLRLHPELIDAFIDWEYVNWKLLFGLPHMFSKDMLAARDTIMGCFADYFTLPREKREGASFFVTETESTMREVGFGDEEMGKFFLFHYWATVGNVYKLAFWLTAYLVQDQELVERIREEVSPAVSLDGTVDETFLQTKCSQLDALINEALRLTVTSPLGRVVMEDTVMGGKVLKKGHKIMLSIQGMHHDPSLWGPESSSLNPTRFLENPKMAKNPTFRPWGGGHSLCPGRHLARRSVMAFVAVLLKKYEVGVEGRGFPRADA
ncbi:cytochrome P450, partial [Dendryphion nanum]